MKELEKQMLFSELISKFILVLVEHGYKVTLGEAWRNPKIADAYASIGKGIKNSVHTHRMAIDLNLFKDGVWLNRTESYLLAGEIWEAMSTSEVQCCWGGRFLDRPDGNHFSFSHAGAK